MKKVLVVGGAGYIGSHTVIDLLDNNMELIIVDNFCNSSPVVIDRLKKISNKQFELYNIDANNYSDLEKVFIENEIDSIINFAGYKAVNESVLKPVMYYENNLGIIINILKLMDKYNINKFVFSSSATVYSTDNKMPLVEDAKLGPINPYGRTKLIIEEILRDYCNANKDKCVVSLRYFNPLGAHSTGLIGEDPNGIPNNLAPYITQVAVGKLPVLRVFGNYYYTKDGTCIIDYVHVCDLAAAHRLAIDYATNNKGYEYINLGSGIGYSVLEVISAFKQVFGFNINYEIVERREGDSKISLADISKAKRLLNWEPVNNLIDMCSSSWNWQKNNKNGYR